MLFIGDNREPWNFLDDYPKEEVLAPNIEFLGWLINCGVGGAGVQFMGDRPIAAGGRQVEKEGGVKPCLENRS